MAQELESALPGIAGNRLWDGADFSAFRLQNGVNLFLHQTRKYRTTTVDLVLRTRLVAGRASRIALVGRLLERGTRRWPNLRAINQFMDDMYGASYAVDVERAGGQQLLHCSFELIDGSLVGENGHLMESLFEFIADLIYHPAGGQSGFEPKYVLQEKRALEIAIRSLYNDKMGYAQRRCVEIMCEGEPIGLSVMGSLDDLPGIDGPSLYETYRQLLKTSPVDIFVAGNFDDRSILQLCETTFSHQRDAAEDLGMPVLLKAREPSIEITETQQLNQGKLVQGYRCSTRFGKKDFPALMLFSSLLGGDAYSRLFKRLREGSGLCYAIESRLDPLGGFLFVDAGVDAEDVGEAKKEIARELEAMQAGVTAEELDWVKGVLVKRLRAIGDSRAGMIRLLLHSWIAGYQASEPLESKLAAVTVDDLSGIAEEVRLDTTFFLH